MSRKKPEREPASATGAATLPRRSVAVPPRLRPLLTLLAVQAGFLIVVCLFAAAYRITPGRFVVADVVGVADTPFVVRARLELESDGSWLPAADVEVVFEGVRAGVGTRPLDGLVTRSDPDGVCSWQALAAPGLHRYRVRLAADDPCGLAVAPSEIVVGVSARDAPPIFVTGAALAEPGAAAALVPLARAHLVTYVFGGPLGPVRSVTELPLAPIVHLSAPPLGTSLSALEEPWSTPPTLICRRQSVVAAAVAAGLEPLRIDPDGSAGQPGVEQVLSWEAARRRLE